MISNKTVIEVAREVLELYDLPPGVSISGRWGELQLLYVFLQDDEGYMRKLIQELKLPTKVSEHYILAEKTLKGFPMKVKVSAQIPIPEEVKSEREIAIERILT